MTCLYTRAMVVIHDCGKERLRNQKVFLSHVLLSKDLPDVASVLRPEVDQRALHRCVGQMKGPLVMKTTRNSKGQLIFIAVFRGCTSFSRMMKNATPQHSLGTKLWDWETGSDEEEIVSNYCRLFKAGNL